MNKPKPTGELEADLKLAHEHSIRNRADLFGSDRCGCFDCLEIFEVDKIARWTDETEGVGATAFCPRCGTDAVIGSKSGFPVERWFLKRMKAVWCPDE